MTEEKEKPAQTKKGVSRRQFIAGTVGGLVVGVAAGAVTGSLGFPTVNPKLLLSLPTKWDQTYDVVIMGSGGAGSAAALGALEGGASVVLLEKGTYGGSTAISGGMLWVPNNSVSKAAGESWPQDQVLLYFSNIGGGEEDTDRINTYLQQGVAYIDHLVSLGLAMQVGVSGAPLMYQMYYNVPGAYTGPAGPMVGPAGMGPALMSFMKTQITSKGATILEHTPVTGLYQDATGRVVGVQARPNSTVASQSASTNITGGNMLIQPYTANQFGTSVINIAARKAVFLCAGGFEYNRDMTQNFLRGPMALNTGVTTLTGDGIQLAMAVGAALGNMNNQWGMPTYNTPTGPVMDTSSTRGAPGAIVVNMAGKRFGNESSCYPVFNRLFYNWSNVESTPAYPNIPAFTIIDSDYNTRYGFVGNSAGKTPGSYVASASTISALATQLSIDPNGLSATVAQFNQYAAAGVDQDFHRGEFITDIRTSGDSTRTDIKNPCLAPLQTPPFYGLEIYPGSIGTCGGPKINSNAQVLDRNGNPIPGLFAAGNDCSNPFGEAYPGGGATVGGAMIFGWVGGKYAASQPSYTL